MGNLSSGKLSGKTALITGAAQGIGAAIATLFHNEGATVYITDIQEELGQALASQLGDKAHFITLDVTREDDWQSVMGRIDQLDIVVNNAGITGFLETTGPHNPEYVDMESWHKVMAVNLDGTVLGCKYGIQKMKGHGGTIVNISSRSGIVGIPAASAYAASKAAVRNHTKSVALYCTEQGYDIRCNSVHPAAIMTPMWDQMLGTGADRDAMIAAVEKDIPMGHMGTSEDVAYAALYLASTDSRYVTGTELNIDGGILAGSAAPPKKHD